jgi:hypothetical protein
MKYEPLIEEWIPVKLHDDYCIKSKWIKEQGFADKVAEHLTGEMAKHICELHNASLKKPANANTTKIQ